MEIKYFGKHHGYARRGESCLTFEIVGATDQASINSDKKDYTTIAHLGDHFQFANYTVASHGDDNQLPSLAVSLIRNNPYLPEILKKQVRIVYGQGPGLFIDEEGEDNRRQRKWVSAKYPEVFNWLDSWRKHPDMEAAEVYFKRAMFEYFYMEGIYSKHLTNRSRRTGGEIPFRGLVCMNGKKMRLAMAGLADPRHELHRADLTHAIHGRWESPWSYESEVWPLFNVENPLSNAVSVNYVADRGFDEYIYAVPTSFYGLREWITGANLNPKYINSYLKNSLSAKIHIKIPNKWIEVKTKAIQDICTKNQELEVDNKPLITEFEGVTIGTAFSLGLVEQVIQKKINAAIDLLSGEGENQGKAFWSRTFQTEHGLESWDFVEIPTKYKEFIESIIEFDKRALSVILAGKGLDPAISNVTNEGVFNSGSEVYYNYLLYLEMQRYLEEFVCNDINTQLWVNFPQLERNRVKLGFYRFAPERQQNTTPQNRLQNQKV